VEPPLWPSRRQGLVFVWETGDAANLVFGERLGADRTISLQASELAHLNGHFAMQLAGGSFFLSQKEAETVRKVVMDSNELSVEAVVRPQEQAATELPGKIISFSSRGRVHNFRLVQRGNTLTFGLHTSHPLSPSKTRLPLFEVPTGRSSHVVVTYTPGRLVAYLDGEKRVDTDRLQGDFYQWRSSPLVFGAEWGGGGDWRGVLEGVAVYNRVLGAQEVEENALRYRALLERRQEIPRVVADARLRNRSKMPSLAEISPYREALVVYEYDVERTVKGQLATDRLRVAHWSILDGDRLPITQAQEGQVLRLVLEPFSANPQLESLYLSDTFEDGRELPLYYAVDPSLGG